MSLIDLNNQVWSQDSDTELGDTPAAGGSAAVTITGDWTGGLTQASRSRGEDRVCIPLPSIIFPASAVPASAACPRVDSKSVKV